LVNIIVGLHQIVVCYDQFLLAVHVVETFLSEGTIIDKHGLEQDDMPPTGSGDDAVIGKRAFRGIETDDGVLPKESNDTSRSIIVHFFP